MCACTNLDENSFGDYSNVSLHFVFMKLFHQITPYLIWVVGVGQFVMEGREGGKKGRRGKGNKMLF